MDKSTWLQCGEITDLADQLRECKSSRPTTRQWYEAQAEIAALQKQVQPLPDGVLRVRVVGGRVVEVLE